MKIAISQQNYILGHFDFNINKIIVAIQNAIKDRADLIVFSELAISGYPPTDFLEINDFVNRKNLKAPPICSTGRSKQDQSSPHSRT